MRDWLKIIAVVLAVFLLSDNTSAQRRNAISKPRLESQDFDPAGDWNFTGRHKVQGGVCPPPATECDAGDGSEERKFFICTSVELKVYACIDDSVGWTEVTGGGNGFGTIGLAIADAAADVLTVTDSVWIDFTTTDNPEDLTAAPIFSVLWEWDNGAGETIQIDPLAPMGAGPGSGLIEVTTDDGEKACFVCNTAAEVASDAFHVYDQVSGKRAFELDVDGVAGSTWFHNVCQSGTESCIEQFLFSTTSPGTAGLGFRVSLNDAAGLAKSITHKQIAPGGFSQLIQDEAFGIWEYEDKKHRFDLYDNAFLEFHGSALVDTFGGVNAYNDFAGTGIYEYGPTYDYVSDPLDDTDWVHSISVEDDYDSNLATPPTRVNQFRFGARGMVQYTSRGTVPTICLDGTSFFFDAGGGVKPQLCICDPDGDGDGVFIYEDGTPCGSTPAGGFGTIGNAVADSRGDTITITDSSTIDFTTTDGPEDLTAIVIANSIGPTEFDEEANYATGGDWTPISGNWDLSASPNVTIVQLEDPGQDFIFSFNSPFLRNINITNLGSGIGGIILDAGSLVDGIDLGAHTHSGGTGGTNVTDLAANAIDATGEFAPGLCAASQILERQGSVWACIATPSGGTRTKSWNLFTPATGDSDKIQWSTATAVTITKVWCSTDTGTVTIMPDERAETTPNSQGTDILSAGLVCDNLSQSSCASGCDVNTITNGTIDAYDPVSLDIDAVSTATFLRVHFEYTVND
ncbi:hypothetical protein LCGC14_0427500 [marine sediment metagenome]|uniref:Uncharacterized protein n=1 Tax=marine sediment metagenome TaxID=412755 RepID=A0A0F9SNY9_9ZZZZ